MTDIFDLRAAAVESGWMIDHADAVGESFYARDGRFRFWIEPEADKVHVALFAGFDRWAVSRIREFPCPWDRVQWIGLQIALDRLWAENRPKSS